MPPVARCGLSSGWRFGAGVIAALHLAALGHPGGDRVRLVLGPLLFSAVLGVPQLCSFSPCCAGPAMSAALSLGLIATLVALSQFKFTILSMVINFFDILIIDSDTVAFLLSIFPDLRTTLSSPEC